MQQQQLSPRKAMLVQMWDENPIFRQVLGICSALAVTNLLSNTVLMCAGLIWATTMSNLTVSLLRNYTPSRVRIMVWVLIISVYVIVVDIVFRAYFPAIHKNIAAYVGLIITNCIVLGRCEAFASKNPPLASFFDGLGAGLGYSGILLAVAFVREVLGFGTVLGYPLPVRPYPWTIMVTPPGAFFVLAIMVWVARAYALRRKKAAEAKEPEAKAPPAKEGAK
jgi:Na+-transporting NADH:ubiquinone oxidoreductase subunit D